MMVVVVRREAEPLKARADQHFSFITPSGSADAGRNYCTAATLNKLRRCGTRPDFTFGCGVNHLGAAGAETSIFRLQMSLQ
jgi:hypothetical protein